MRKEGRREEGEETEADRQRGRQTDRARQTDRDVKRNTRKTYKIRMKRKN